MNLIETLEREAIDALTKDKPVPEFRPGDTLRVGVKVIEGDRTRVQNFEGVCIARANKGVGSSFTVRKISFGEGVERVFPLYSPIIDQIEVVRRGDVRRAKLYYLRGRTGKAARIAERRDVRRDVAAAQGAETEAPQPKRSSRGLPRRSSPSTRRAPLGRRLFVLRETRHERLLARCASVFAAVASPPSPPPAGPGKATLTLERVFDSPSLSGPTPALGEAVARRPVS